MASTYTKMQKQVPAPPSPQPVHASRRGYWIGVVIALVGVAAGLAWGLTAYQSYQGRIEDFPRLTDPGSVTVRFATPTERVLYYEGSAAPNLASLDIRVTGPTGDRISVAPFEGDLRYDTPSGRVGVAIGTFGAPTAGRYRIVAGAGPSADVNPVIAVGETVPAGTIASVVGALFLIGASLVMGLGLMVLTAVRVSRSRS